MINHTSTLKQLRLKEFLGKCVRKKVSQGVGVPGLACENNAVAGYQESPPPRHRQRHVGHQSSKSATTKGQLKRTQSNLDKGFDKNDIPGPLSPL